MYVLCMVKVYGKKLLVQYQKLGKNRYLRTITLDGEVINIDGNFGVINIIKDSKKELKEDFNYYIKRYTKK